MELSPSLQLIDCPHPDKRKDVVDKMMLVDILAWAIDNPAPATACLASGDRDFAYCLSTLRNRGYTVALIAPTSVHGALRAQADFTFEWTDIFPAIPLTPPKPPDATPAVVPPEARRLSKGIQCDPLPTGPSSISPADISGRELEKPNSLDEAASEDVPRSTVASDRPTDPADQETVIEGFSPPSPYPATQPSSSPVLSWASIARTFGPAPSLNSSAPVFTPLPTPSSSPALYADLIAVLQEARAEGLTRPTRNYISTALSKRNSFVYQYAGVRYDFRP